MENRQAVRNRQSRWKWSGRSDLPSPALGMRVQWIPMDRAHTVLAKVLAKRGLHAHAVAAMLVTRVQEWLAKEVPQLAGALQVGSFKDGVLTVRCSHSIAAQECRQIVVRLETFIRKECREERLKEVRLLRAS